MLFTGDASADSIEQILKHIPQKISVLKVPHHGAFGGINKRIITALNPEYSIISVGENRFGHPSRYTLHLLKNTKILRTDIHNSIKIKANNKKYQIFTYNPAKQKYEKVNNN